MGKGSDLHFVPASIQYSGPADVSTYFRPRETGVAVDDLPLKEAEFRGRRLAGTVIHLRGDFSGNILAGKKDSVTEEKSWEVLSNFSSFTFWKHDDAPDKTDGLYRCIEWLSLSKQVHAPVTAEEIAESS